MNSNYKRMFVLGEDEYKDFKRYKASLVPPPAASSINTVKCHICNREYPNANILAHHLKSHVDGFKCNICGKVFESKQNLTAHLQKHAPQVQPSKHSVLDNSMPNQPLQQAVPPVQHVDVVKKRKPHKQRSVINFTATKWLTLK